MPSLKGQAVRGALYLGGTTVIARVMSVVSGIVLARLLDPEQFGLISLCFIILSVVSLVAPLGLAPALVRYRGDVARASFQVFVWIMAAGTAAFLAVVLAREPLARFLGNPAVADLIPWMSLMILFDVAGKVPEALLERDLAFKRMSTIALVGEVLFIVVSITMAWLGAGVWSLVTAQLLRSALGSVLCILWYPGREWFRPKAWDGGIMRDLLRYGIRSVGSNAVVKFYLNVDNFVVGRLFGAAVLGYYVKAFSFTTSTVDNLHKTIGTVLMPTYAKIQHDRERLTAAYLRSLRIIAAMTIPMAFAILVTAPVLVPTLLGAKWLPMVPMLQVLALMSVIKPVSSSAASVFNAVGEPGRNLTAGLVVVGIMLLMMAALASWGAVGIAWAVVASHVAGYLYNVLQMRHVLGRAARGMIPVVLPPLAASGVMAAAMHGVRLLLPPAVSGFGGAGVLAAMTAAGAGVYAAQTYLFHRPVFDEFRDLLTAVRARGERPAAGA